MDTPLPFYLLEIKFQKKSSEKAKKFHISATSRPYEFKDNKQILVIPRFDSKKDDGLYLCNAAQFSSFETLHINVTAYCEFQNYVKIKSKFSESSAKLSQNSAN